MPENNDQKIKLVGYAPAELSVYDALEYMIHFKLLSGDRHHANELYTQHEKSVMEYRLWEVLISASEVGVLSSRYMPSVPDVSAT
jgi:hypothetical protein